MKVRELIALLSICDAKEEEIMIVYDSPDGRRIVVPVETIISLEGTALGVTNSIYEPIEDDESLGSVVNKFAFNPSIPFDNIRLIKGES